MQRNLDHTVTISSKRPVSRSKCRIFFSFLLPLSLGFCLSAQLSVCLSVVVLSLQLFVHFKQQAGPLSFKPRRLAIPPQSLNTVTG